MSKIGKQIAKGTLDSKLKERNIIRTIRRIQKSERRLLREVKSMIDGNMSKDEIVPVCKNVLDSRKSIQKLKRLQYYVKSIQSFYRRAQLALINGETMENIARSMNVVNRVLSMESIDETMSGIENELDELNLNLDQVNEILNDYSDPLINEDAYINNIIDKLKEAKPEEVELKISEIIDQDLLPDVPDELFEVPTKRTLEN